MEKISKRRERETGISLLWLEGILFSYLQGAKRRRWNCKGVKEDSWKGHWKRVFQRKKHLEALGMAKV